MVATRLAAGPTWAASACRPRPSTNLGVTGTTRQRRSSVWGERHGVAAMFVGGPNSRTLVVLDPSLPGLYPGPVRRRPRGFGRSAAPHDRCEQIGLLYLTSAFGFFGIAGAMALLMRAELAQPGLQFLSPEQYNQLFTIHGTVMLLLFATPVVFGFANYLVPLQIGAPDVAFPRLNALAYWLYVLGGLLVVGGFLTPAGAADFGWTAYTPLSRGENSQASVAICGLLASCCPGWARSSVRSTS